MIDPMPSIVPDRASSLCIHENIAQACKKYKFDLSKIFYAEDITTAKARRLAQGSVALIIDSKEEGNSNEVTDKQQLLAYKITTIRPTYLFVTENSSKSSIPSDYREVEMNGLDQSIKIYQLDDRFEKTLRALDSFSKWISKIPTWWLQKLFDNYVILPIIAVGKKRLERLGDQHKIKAMLEKLKNGETKTFQIENLISRETIVTRKALQNAVDELQALLKDPKKKKIAAFLINKLIDQFPALSLELQQAKSGAQIAKTIAKFIVKVPFVVIINNILTLLLPVLAPVFLISHPLDAITKISSKIVQIARLICTNPTNWTKIGSGMIGYSVGEMLIRMGPVEAGFMLLGILLVLVGIIGGMVLRAEESSEDGRGAFRGALEGLLDQISVMPASFLAALNLGVFIGFIQGLSPEFVVHHFKIPKVNRTQTISSNN